MSIFNGSGENCLHIYYIQCIQYAHIFLKQIGGASASLFLPSWTININCSNYFVYVFMYTKNYNDICVYIIFHWIKWIFLCDEFPVRLSFTMTINNVQGPSLFVDGLNLVTPCFSHGQFYVGCSRLGSRSRLFIHTPEDKTVNIVHHEVLNLQ